MERDKWADYWENESATGECFVSKEGKKHPELIEYWDSLFQSINAGASILDVASGAGSIFTSIQKSSRLQLVSSDLSFSALRKQQSRNSRVQLVNSSADNRIFELGSFDVVVSQYGIEYAPKEAFKAANEILKPGGKLTCLCHIEDGFIDSRNQTEKEGIELCLATSFIDISTELTRAMFTHEQSKIAPLMKQFQNVEPEMANFARQNPTGFQYHLYSGFRQLMEGIQNYTCTDITDWLQQMKNELEKIQIRLHEMIEAAQSRNDMSDIAQILIASGTEEIQLKPFFISSHEKPIAWQLTAIKRH